MTYLVTLVDKLMCSRNELQAVDVVELARHFVAEQPARSSGRYGPRIDIFRVAPD